MKSILRIAAGFIVTMGLFSFARTASPPQLSGYSTGLRMQVSAAGVPVAILWDYDFNAPNSRACTTVIVTGCVSGFTVSVVNSLNVTVSGPVVVALPAIINATGPTLGMSAPFTPPVTMGQYQILSSVNWKDSSGVAQSGPTAALSFPVIPSGPLNLRTQ